MNKTYHALTRNKTSRFLYGIYNEHFAYACAKLPDRNVAQRKKFIIYGQGRTGSTLLVNVLNSHPQIICEREILMDKNLPLDNKAADPYAMLRGKASLFRHKVYGFKVKIYQLTAQPKIESPRSFLETAVGSGWKIIFLTRRNVFEHVLSNLIAESLNQYHFSKNGNTNRFQELKLKVELDQLRERMEERLRYSREEEESLEGIDHARITYEDLARDKQAAADVVFRHLGLNSINVRTSLKKSNTKKYSDLLQNFSEIREFLEGNGYGSFLDPARI